MKQVKKVYISTPLKPGKFNLRAIQKAILKEKVFAFIPPTEEKNDQYLGSHTDRLQIDLCDELWIFGPMGRDCAWEAGYASALGIPIVFYRSDDNAHIISEDWMLFTDKLTFRTVEE